MRMKALSLVAVLLGSFLVCGCTGEEEKVPDPQPESSLNSSVGTPVGAGAAPSGAAPAPDPTGSGGVSAGKPAPGDIQDAGRGSR
jgi:hypothetical protein